MVIPVLAPTGAVSGEKGTRSKIQQPGSKMVRIQESDGQQGYLRAMHF